MNRTILKDSESIWTRRSTMVAVGYLAAAGILLGMVGASVAGPDTAEHAERLERRTAAELASLTESAAAIRAIAGESIRRETSILKTSLDALTAWGGRGTGELPLLPEGVAAAIISPAGEIELELGRFDLGNPALISSALADGRTIAVAPEHGPPGASGLYGLAPAVPAGTGFYLIDSSGALVETLAQRPQPTAPLATPVSAGSMRTASGNPKHGRLVIARTAVGSTGITAVAEKFLNPAELAGSGSALAAYAVAGLGLLLSIAFCHALAVMLRREDAEETEVEREPAVRQPPPPVAIAPEDVLRIEDCEQGFVFGRSIKNLRDALGAGVSGPDLAACAKSPILRALSRHVRHATPADAVDELGKAA